MLGSWALEIRQRTLDRARGLVEARRHDLSGVGQFVAFAGFPRSGHTLVGSLLTAHPDAVISHELDALSYVRQGIDRRALYGLILRNDRRFAQAGSSWTSYDYSVPDQWQGRYRNLTVLGDKKGGRTARWFHERPALLDELRQKVGVPVRFVVVTRNPADNIARMATKANGLEDSIRSYFERADAVQWLLSEADCYQLAYEDFVLSTSESLAGLCRWLELEPDLGYLASCAGMVRESRPARDEVDWGNRLSRVKMEAEKRPFLADYAF